ncbi:MAG: hypothetical protein K0S61_2979 [Anaerocolumna sp.]|nr:hypothetical protein [Anaerocolumna sp.]
MRTKKIIMLLGVTMAMVLVAGGCKANDAKSVTESNKPAVETSANETTIGKQGINAESSTTETDATKLSSENAITGTEVVKEVPMVELPEGIVGMKAETEPNEDLKNLIKEYMEIPDDFLESTQYYYNYVDLDGDGTDEIFVIVQGLYTSGSGGSSALIVSEKAGKLHVMQDFTLVNAPVIISDDEIVNGYKTIIVPYYGNYKSQYSVLTYTDGEYTNVPDGKIIDTLDGIKGNAIIANDLIQEISNGILGLNLSK